MATARKTLTLVPSAIELKFSADEILAWYNYLLYAKFDRLQQLRTGLPFKQLMHKLYPYHMGQRHLLRQPRTQEEREQSFLDLKQALERVGVAKSFNIKLLAAGDKEELLHLAHWFQKFYQVNNDADIFCYDAVRARQGQAMPRSEQSDDRPTVNALEEEMQKLKLNNEKGAVTKEAAIKTQAEQKNEKPIKLKAEKALALVNNSDQNELPLRPQVFYKETKTSLLKKEATIRTLASGDAPSFNLAPRVKSKQPKAAKATNAKDIAQKSAKSNQQAKKRANGGAASSPERRRWHVKMQVNPSKQQRSLSTTGRCASCEGALMQHSAKTQGIATQAAGLAAAIATKEDKKYGVTSQVHVKRQPLRHIAPQWVAVGQTVGKNHEKPSRVARWKY